MTTFVMSHFDQFEKITGSERHRWGIRAVQAAAYVWGREDAGDPNTCYSNEFGQAYAMAQHITGGFAGPIQVAYREWIGTDRLLVVQPGGSRRVVQIAYIDEQVRAHLAVYAGERYSGLIRTLPSDC